MNSSDISTDAREAFLEYLIAFGSGKEHDFEAFCAARPAIATELRALRELATHLDALPGDTMTDRIWRRYGSDVDPNISLDGRPDDEKKAATGEDRAEVAEQLANLHMKGGRYRLQAEMDRGGQGAVLSVWDSDLRRNLAMKIVLLRPDAPTPEQSIDPKALRRFLEEAQVTGQLDHPGIVPVHDLGLDDEGRVYFTMKLVRGENLRAIFKKVKTGEDDWNRTRALGVIYKVCEAMSYAHHKGVIHRDLKPANIMVGRFGAVYVMDWGLAKVAGRVELNDETTERRGTPSTEFRISTPRGPDSSLHTMAGDVLGTPSYMPPEQARGELDGMGPHSDVYAAGALLYELVAGRMPYETPGEPLNNIEIWRKVFDGPPVPVGEVATDLPLELEAIVEKAMQRAPADRYPDMAALAEDLRAYMENRVVRAHATGAIPEFRKWVRRNRALATACASAIALVIIGFGVSLFLRQRAVRAEDTARTEAQRANDEAARALEAERVAQSEAVRANEAALEASRSAETAGQVSDFMVGLFSVSDPGEARGNTITAREILDRGADRIERELAHQPAVRSALMVTMGSVYRSLGLYDDAVALLEASLEERRATLGPEHTLVADAMNELGQLQLARGEYARAEPLLRDALAMRTTLLGDDDLAVAETAYLLAEVLRETARYGEADPVYREALAIRRARLPRSPEVADCLNGLAFNLLSQGDYDAPEPLLREALAILRAKLGDHPAVASNLNDLAVFLYQARRFDEVEALYREALAMKKRVFTEVHPEVALGLNNLATFLHDQREFEDAEALYREALAIQLELLGATHPDVAQAQNNLAFVLMDQGDLDGAREMFASALETFLRVYRADHPAVRGAITNSITFLRLLVDAREAEFGRESVEYADASVELADALVRVDANEEAFERAESALVFLSETLAPEDWRTMRAQAVLGAAMSGSGEHDEAEPLLLDALSVIERERGGDAPETRRVREGLLRLYEASGRDDDAQRVRVRLGSK